MNSNFVARFFDWNREVVESAETPIMKFVVMLLPVVTPFVPAMIVGIRLYSIYFDEIGARLLQYAGPTVVVWAAVFAAFITSLAVELLGWVGAIAFIRNVYHFMKNDRDGVLLSVGLTGIAYAFYVACIFLVNSQLSQDVPNKASVLGLLIFLSIPAGLIYADGMAEKLSDEKDKELRKESREERLERLRIKHQFSGGGSALNQKKDWRALSTEEKRQVINVLTVEEIMQKYPVSRSTAFGWKSKKV
jgi:hypothetical protein